MPIYIAFIFALLGILVGWGLKSASLPKRNETKDGPDFPETPSGYILIPKFIYQNLPGWKQEAIYDAHEQFARTFKDGKHYVTYRTDGRMASDPVKKLRKI